VGHDLAQVNVSRMLAPLDDPMMREFVAAIEPVERLAAASPGFVWRIADEARRKGADSSVLAALRRAVP
jgi:Domain of unknown function (DUF3291)